jgi:hypothetical protein
MGFHESDRILSKNRAHNEAYNQYTTMRNQGMSNEDIVELVQTHQETDLFRSTVNALIIQLAASL